MTWPNDLAAVELARLEDLVHAELAVVRAGLETHALMPDSDRAGHVVELIALVAPEVFDRALRREVEQVVARAADGWHHVIALEMAMSLLDGDQVRLEGALKGGQSAASSLREIVLEAVALGIDRIPWQQVFALAYLGVESRHFDAQAWTCVLAMARCPEPRRRHNVLFLRNRAMALGMEPTAVTELLDTGRLPNPFLKIHEATLSRAFVRMAAPLPPRLRPVSPARTPEEVEDGADEVPTASLEAAELARRLAALPASRRLIELPPSAPAPPG